MIPPESVADAIGTTTPVEDLPDPDLTENARTVLPRRYLKKDAEGNPTERPQDMFWRVARVIASQDARYGASEAEVQRTARTFYRLMASGQFEPNSPTLMNAGRPLGQLSACFVLPVPDALDGIYETLKNMALIHQSGGGCVSADAHVHTTFCGVETIETLYGRVRDQVVSEEVHDDHRILDVGDLEIETLSLDPETGRFEPRAVTHLWKWDVPADEQLTVSTADGSEVTTSSWHPFMVFTEEGVVERRADELTEDDLLLTSNRSAREAWPFTEPVRAHGFTVDEDLAWLVGYFLGDGSLDVFHNRTTDYEALRLRFFDGRRESIDRAAGILADHGIRVTPQQDSRDLWRLTATDASFVPGFARLAELEPGAKGDRLTMPEWVSKSPLSVVAAFLGGLVDSDGHVNPNRKRVVLSTVSPRLARRLTSLLSTLGLDPSLMEKPPTGKAKRTEYRVKMANARKSPELVRLIEDHVNDRVRGDRLDALRRRAEHNSHARVPLPFGAIADLLEAAGVATATTTIHRGPVEIGGEEFWLHRAKWGHGIGEDKLRRLAGALGRVLPEETYGRRLEQLERLADGWTVVTSVRTTDAPTDFYDFTVEEHNNYLAGGGVGKMMVIHNTGFGFSRLRPRGDVVKSTMGVASGPVSFMEVYDASTEAVKQGGTRRGANMGILRVDHPDVLEFIDCKEDGDKVTNFNISVAVTQDFVEAVERGEDYDLINPRTGEVEDRLPAEEVFDKIVHGAWRNGEPGVFLIDEANRYNPVPHLGSYEATNPCGEQPLLPYDVCNLGSVNVGHYARDGEIDWDGLRETVHRATHFLDNVIDANNYPLREIDDLSKRIRRIGLGVMGWADMLIRLGIPYGSEESIRLGEKLMGFIDEASKVESERLADERGVFPEWRQSIWGPDETCARDANGDRVRPFRRLRNCNLTTVAPTGTISIIAGCSGGIEPLYAVAFMRNQAGTLMPDVNDDFVRMAKEGGWHTEELMRKVADEGHIHFDEVPDEVQDLFVTAHDVTPEQHIRMQAAFQKHTDSAISKTCNFSEEATEEDVREIYQLAFRLGLKGVTVYRDGSREGQVLSTGKTAKKVKGDAGEEAAARVTGFLEEVDDAADIATELASALERMDEMERERASLANERDRAKRKIAELESGMVKQPVVRDRPDVLGGHTRKIESPLGTMYVTINEDEEGRPFEVFVALGKAGGAAMADAEAIGRLISLALRSGISLRKIHKQLRGISSDRAVGYGDNKVLSSPDAIAQVIEQYLEEKEGVQGELPIQEPGAAKTTNGGVQTAEKPVLERFSEEAAREFLGTCPDCGSSLQFQEGCAACVACGYSECG